MAAHRTGGEKNLGAKRSQKGDSEGNKQKSKRQRESAEQSPRTRPRGVHE